MLLLDAAVAVGPVYGYYAQLKLIQKEKSLGSFSGDVCAILIVSNLLRIYFWFTNGYATNLFVQAFFVIGIQFMLLKECVELKKHPNSDKFWRWNHFEEYTTFVLKLTALMTVLTVLAMVARIDSFGHLLGYVSMSIEATLALPQLMANHRAKATTGLSYALIGSWFGGDLFKTFYFVIENQPLPFIMCGSFQLFIDVLIILQIIFYSGNKPTPYSPVGDGIQTTE